MASEIEMESTSNNRMSGLPPPYQAATASPPPYQPTKYSSPTVDSNDDMAEVASFGDGKIRVTNRYLIVNGHYGNEVVTNIPYDTYLTGILSLDRWFSAFQRFGAYAFSKTQHSIILDLKSVTSVQHTIYQFTVIRFTLADWIGLLLSLGFCILLIITIATGFGIAVTQHPNNFKGTTVVVTLTMFFYLLMLAWFSFLRHRPEPSVLGFLISYKSPVIILTGVLVFIMFLAALAAQVYLLHSPSLTHTHAHQQHRQLLSISALSILTRMLSTHRAQSMPTQTPCLSPM